MHRINVTIIVSANKITDFETVKNLKDEEIDILTEKIIGDKIRLRRQIYILLNRSAEEV